MKIADKSAGCCGFIGDFFIYGFCLFPLEYRTIEACGVRTLAVC